MSFSDENDRDDRLSKFVPRFAENWPLVRQLVYDRRFRIVAVIVFLVVGSLLAAFLKVVPASPPTYQPPIRISLMSMWEASSSARAATESASKGDWKLALWNWRAALELNPGSDDLCRRALISLSRMPDPARESLGFAMEQVQSLFDLSGITVNNLAAAVPLLDHYGSDALIIDLLAPRRRSLPPPLLAALAKSRLRLGDVTQFGNLRPEIAGKLDPKDEWNLYDAAWRWGWGPEDAAAAGRAELDRAAEDPARRVLALRLMAKAAAARDDLDSFLRAYNDITKAGADQAEDHLEYWELLAHLGRQSEAEAMAAAYAAAPRTPVELISLSRTLDGLGLRARAIQTMEKNRAQFSDSVEVWSRLAELYIKNQSWEGLRELSVELRNDKVQSADMPGYGWYLEGVASVKQGALDSARDQFSRAAEMPIKPPFIAYKTVAGLDKLGYSDFAQKIRAQLNSASTNNYDYCFSVAQAAYRADDFELFRMASSQAYQADPKSLEAANSLATALMYVRENPANAVKLTEQCVAGDPGNSAYQVNHALALALNRQTAEAEKSLGQIDIGKLPRKLKTLAHLAKLEILVENSQTNLYRGELLAIDPRFLRGELLTWVKAL